MKNNLSKEDKSGRNPPAYEILAPAGSRDSLEAAVQNGADAVYLSGKDFGARKFAANFSRKELLDAVDYCHERGVSVYVTVNTLLFNEELEKLKETIDYYYIIGVDAVIVQDMGVLNFIRRNYPNLDVHCSTQMSAQTPEDVCYLESLGVKRVVLGREMSLEDIRRTKEKTNIELEVFIHGALCISLSGQCLMSSVIGGRSGNRGSCAQPCRQKYSLYDNDTGKKIPSDLGDYLLSPKDLSTAEGISEVLEAGAFSLKIEGRMKKPEYVATVVKVYRKLIKNAYGGSMNMKDLEKDLEDLTIFNRGFTMGHLFGETGRELMSMKNPGNQGIYIGKVIKQDHSKGKISIALERDLSHNDEIQIRRLEGTLGARVERLEDRGNVVKHCTKNKTCQVNFKHRVKIGESVYKTFDEALMKEARQTYHKELLQIPLKGQFTFREGAPMRGRLSDGKISVLMESTNLAQKSMGKSLTTSGLQKQLSKLGGTPYRMESIEIDLQGEIFLPAKEINEFRRNLISAFGEQRVQRFRRKHSEIPRVSGGLEQDAMIPSASTMENGQRKQEDPSVKSRKIQFTYSIRSLKQLEKLLELQAKIIYYKDFKTLREAYQIIEKKNLEGKFIPEVHSSLTGEDLEFYKRITSINEDGSLLIQSLGQIGVFEGRKLVGDVSLNIVNDFAYKYYRSQGFQRLTLSPELNLKQIKEMDLDFSATEIFGYGHLPVMGMKHCPVSTVQGLGKNCKLCEKKNYSLLDRFDEHFPLVNRGKCRMEVYHSKKHLLAEDMKNLEEAGVGYFRLNFVNESPREMENIVELHRSLLEGKSGRKEELLEQLKKGKITKGHLYRGVE